MNEARDANRSIWDELTRDNPLRRGMQTYRERIIHMALGNEPRSQMIIAPPGCGKGHALEQAIIAAGKQPFLFGKVTHNAMPFMLQQCSRPGFVGVADDQDALLQDLPCLEHISAATSSNEDAFSRSGAADTMRRSDRFVYNCVIGFTSNIDPRDSTVVGRKVADFWKKLERRIQIRKITATDEERFQYTCFQIICEGALRKTHHTTEAINEVLEFLWRHQTDDPSLGGVKNALSARERYSNWRSHVIGDKSREEPELGPQPKIVPADRIKNGQVHVVAMPVIRTRADIAYELSDKLWSLPQAGSIDDHVADLGYIAGLLQEYQSLAQSAEFARGLERASKSTVRAPTC